MNILVKFNEKNYQLMLNSESTIELAPKSNVSKQFIYNHVHLIPNIKLKNLTSFSIDLTGIVHNVHTKVINNNNLTTFDLIDLVDLASFISIESWNVVNLEEKQIIRINSGIIKKTLPLIVSINELTLITIESNYKKNINVVNLIDLTALSQPKKIIRNLKEINKNELQYLYIIKARIINALIQNNLIKLTFLDENKTNFFINIWEVNKLKPLITGNLSKTKFLINVYFLLILGSNFEDTLNSLKKFYLVLLELTFKVVIKNNVLYYNLEKLESLPVEILITKNNNKEQEVLVNILENPVITKTENFQKETVNLEDQIGKKVQVELVQEEPIKRPQNLKRKNETESDKTVPTKTTGKKVRKLIDN